MAEVRTLVHSHVKALSGITTIDAIVVDLLLPLFEDYAHLNVS